MSRSGRYSPYGVAVLAVAVMSRVGRYCCAKWLLWPVPVAVMSRTGRYLPHGVAVLARIAGRYEP